MKSKIGIHHFGRHRGFWGIWKCVSETGSAMFVKDCFTFEQAIVETYALNGWGTPKNITRKF